MKDSQNFLVSSVLPYLSTPELFAFRLSNHFAKEACLSEELWDMAAVKFTGYPTLNSQYVKLFQRESWYQIGAEDRYNQITSKPERSRRVQEKEFVHFWDGIRILRAETAMRNQERVVRNRPFANVLFSESSDYDYDMESIMFHLYYDVQPLSDWKMITWINKTRGAIRGADQPEDAWYTEDGPEQLLWPLEITETGVFLVTAPTQKIILELQMLGNVVRYRGQFDAQHVITGGLTFENVERLLSEYFEQAMDFYQVENIADDVGNWDDVISGYVSLSIQSIDGKEIYQVNA